MTNEITGNTLNKHQKTLFKEYVEKYALSKEMSLYLASLYGQTREGCMISDPIVYVKTHPVSLSVALNVNSEGVLEDLVKNFLKK
jgi:hypothetical protein